MQLNASTLFAIGAAIANLVWMLATLSIKNQIGIKIDALKEWMDQRYVAAKEFTGYQQVISTQHTELERRLTKLELNHK